MKFTFIDGEKICTYNDGKIEEFESGYIARYKETELRSRKNKEWKKRTDDMLADFYEEESAGVYSRIIAAYPYDEERIVYAFDVEDSSFLYFKYLFDEKQTEAHIFSSNEETFSSLSVRGNGGFAVSLKKGYAADIAVMDERGDYKRLTGGDSLDENPCFTENGDILFNSYAVGRDENGEFVEYMPSEIYLFKMREETVESVISDEKYSFVKPMKKGRAVYCIRMEKEKVKNPNIFISILLIPVRIVQAIIGFISLFVNIFAGKPLVDGKNGKYRSGGGAVKTPGKDDRQIAVHNYLLSVGEQLEKNKKDGDEVGFAPKNWKLIKIEGGETEEILSGVLDYAFVGESIVYTNGKRVFIYEGGKRTKVCNTSFCISVGALGEKSKEESDFD